MTRNAARGSFLVSTVLGGASLMAAHGMPAHAQDVAAAEGRVEAVEEIVVTGSRIRRADTDTAAPLRFIDPEFLTDRGFIQTGQALNQMTANIPMNPIAAGNGSAAGSGQQFPNLFGLGAGRTLTLVNGRRFVTSSSGLGDRVVDTNVIPTGLLERIDVVQAGGAAVYGSDAIAGVVNYVLKKDFEGFELDAQSGASTHGDYPQHSLRATFGRNFAEGRGNFAVNAEWSKTEPLFDKDRPRTNLARVTVNNPENTGPNDGIPQVMPIFDARFWEFNYNGVIFTTPAPVPNFLLRSGGVPQQFSPSGELVAYDPGTIHGVPFASGGEGFSYRDLAALYTGVERASANAIGHFDLTDRVTLSAELLYSETEGSDPYAEVPSHTILNPAASGAGAIPFTRDNAFLTPSAVAALSAAHPAFGAGAPLFLSKAWSDLLPTREGTTSTDTYRALLALDGDFDVGERNYYWSLSFSRGVTDGATRSYGILNAQFANALNAVRDGAGNVVCAINVDADPTNDDPACAPLNPFGQGNVSRAAQEYVTTQVGVDYENTQDDFLATIGGDLFRLPAGAVKFSLGYEHRREKAEFTPLEPNRLGLVGSGVQEHATSGKYHTNEFSAELLVPIFGRDVSLPFVQALELSGSYRFVDHSIAGEENVWGAGLRWQVTPSVTLRASRSRNFRAPTLDQLFAPATTALGSISVDPCDADRINGGPNPAVRLANCQAEFAANPSYGPLEDFQDPAENFNTALITTGGNPDLRNEVSDTWTWGIVLQPQAVPGLTIIADRIEVDLKDGLSAFSPQNFLETCYDSSPQPADICSRFTRDSTGAIVAAQSTTYNAGLVRFRGETYNIHYAFPVGRLFGDRDLGRLDLLLESTHVSLLETSVTGFDRTRTDGTTVQPDWVTRLDATYTRGPWRATYSVYHLPSQPISRTDTIETNPNPVLESNTRHSISAEYDFGRYAVRAGVINFTDEEPSYPSRSYGDILGRQYYVGVRARF